MADARTTGTHRRGANPERVLTFKIDGSDIVFDATAQHGSAVAGIGRAVSMSANGTVRLTGAGEAVVGELLSVEPGGVCSVRVEGVCQLRKGDGAVSFGTRIVGDVLSTVRGYIRSAGAPGAAYAEAAADDSSVSRGMVLDASDAANVEVLLS